jgi:3-deoxy-D-manno-octulosonic-acid transferase
VRQVYSALYLLLLPLVLSRLWWRGRRNPAYRERWQERIGSYSRTAADHRPFWVHAVSVGEVAASVPLVKALREVFPAHPVLFTTTTPTGRDAVERQFGQGVAHVYFPYDVGFVVRRFLTHFKPRALLLMETELWPNVMAVCERQALPVFLVNGRLSASSARRYGWFKPLVRSMLAAVTKAAVQTESDAERLVALGAAAERVIVTGSLKFDLHVPASIYEEAAAVRRELGQSRSLFMAGSTRAGEEELLLDAFAQVKLRFPAALMVLAPRHPERFVEVAELCRRRGYRLHLRSAGVTCADTVDVFLLDSMGELMRF